MSLLTKETGKRIRLFRNARKITLEEMARALCKSKATVSKYETGDITMDIETLYEIASVLGLHVDQLLFQPPDRNPPAELKTLPAFFRDLSRFYSYYYDGRTRKILRTVCEILAPSGTEENQYKIIMYMNCPDLNRCQICENTYRGYISHYDTLSIIEVVHQDNPIEHGSIQILAPFMDSETKWGLWNGISSRPLMPVALKMLFSKYPLKEDDALETQLKISREDIRLLKHYNMFSVI